MRMSDWSSDGCSSDLPVLAAIGFGRRETPVSRLVGTARRLLQQRLPLVTRQTLIVPVGAAMLAAMVEEADIVVRCLKRLDLGRDEGVEFVQIGLQIGRHRKIPRLDRKSVV